MGGDEFVIVVPDFPDDYSPQLERLRAAAVAAGEIVSEEPCLSMSVGVAIYPVDGRDLETLLANADKRMYQLKRQSKSESGQKKVAAESSESGDESDLRNLAFAGTKELALVEVESGGG
jgi:diguanylate cyclase (GGDEF)-like protein